MTNKETFLATYQEQLIKAVTEHPEEYGYPASECEFVFARMTAAIEKGSFNKEGRAFKTTCKVLGIKHTYKAIQQYLNGATEVL